MVEEMEEEMGVLPPRDGTRVREGERPSSSSEDSMKLPIPPLLRMSSPVGVGGWVVELTGR